jgi:hypothetical protein
MSGSGDALFGRRLFQNGKRADAAGLGENQVLSRLVGGLGKFCAELLQFGSARSAACDFAIAFDSSHARIGPCHKETRRQMAYGKLPKAAGSIFVAGRRRSVNRMACEATGPC